MDEAERRKLAEALKAGSRFGGQTSGGQTFGGNTFGGNTFGGNQFGRSAPPNYGAMAGPQAAGAAMPQPIPPAANFAPLAGPQVMGAPGFQNTAEADAAVARSPIAPPQPASPVIAPGNQQPPPQPAPMDYGSLAAPQALGSPGMMKMPQTSAELEAWRRLMDQMQIARQGA